MKIWVAEYFAFACLEYANTLRLNPNICDEMKQNARHWDEGAATHLQMKGVAGRNLRHFDRMDKPMNGGRRKYINTILCHKRLLNQKEKKMCRKRYIIAHVIEDLLIAVNTLLKSETHTIAYRIHPPSPMQRQ